VIQEHHARRLHWDLRLERDGVYVSWAVPKGLPADKSTNHLAVHVEDHPLEYGSFEGIIPEGEYGAGEVKIWDKGTYEASKWTDREVKFHLHGSRVDARFVLFCIGGDEWLLHREDPPSAGWQPLPAIVEPMLAVSGDLPPDAGDAWRYEFKWDGVRTIAYVEGGRLRLTSRAARDRTTAYPELRALAETLGSRQVVLDGEVIALDANGRPSFEALQPRMLVDDPARARRLAATAPITYILFDLLHLDGASTVALSYLERRRLLEGLGLAGPHWAVPPSHRGPGADVLAAAKSGGLEGVVAKRADSPYRPGRRSADWVKVKLSRTQSVVIGGYSAPKGSRAGFGALLVGIPEVGGLAYAGKVGTGFSERAVDDLLSRLQPLRRTSPPFTTPVPAADAASATWVEPQLVGEVRFSEWTRAGRLRHPAWLGLRTDLEPTDVVREDVAVGQAVREDVPADQTRATRGRR
jgi:bifunctional non-homologous end joining protein LigD